MNTTIMIEFIIGESIQSFSMHIREPTHVLTPLADF